MEQEINVMIFYVSAAVFAGLVSVLAYVLCAQKKRKGISYRAAIYKINNYAQSEFHGKHAIAKFCEVHDIKDKTAFLDAVSSEGSKVLVPDTIAEALNKIGYKVHLVNKVYYLDDAS